MFRHSYGAEDPLPSSLIALDSNPSYNTNQLLQRTNLASSTLQNTKADPLYQTLQNEFTSLYNKLNTIISNLSVQAGPLEFAFQTAVIAAGSITFTTSSNTQAVTVANNSSIVLGNSSFVTLIITTDTVNHSNCSITPSSSSANIDVTLTGQATGQPGNVNLKGYVYITGLVSLNGATLVISGSHAVAATGGVLTMSSPFGGKVVIGNIIPLSWTYANGLNNVNVSSLSTSSNLFLNSGNGMYIASTPYPNQIGIVSSANVTSVLATLGSTGSINVGNTSIVTTDTQGNVTINGNLSVTGTFDGKAPVSTVNLNVTQNLAVNTSCVYKCTNGNLTGVVTISGYQNYLPNNGGGTVPFPANLFNNSVPIIVMAVPIYNDSYFLSQNNQDSTKCCAEIEITLVDQTGFHFVYYAGNGSDGVGSDKPGLPQSNNWFTLPMFSFIALPLNLSPISSTITTYSN